MTPSRDKGFTLVELSIVLVIIGLLIGGILVGNAMIESSKTQAFVRQLGQFDAAVNGFITKFGQLPGDTNKMGTYAGNNDGKIQSWPVFPGSVNSSSGEIGKFWSDLMIGGMSVEDGVSYIDSSGTSNYSPGTYPSAKLGKNASFMTFGAYTNINYYLASNLTASYNPFALTPAFLPNEVMAVDAKIDDAVANTGLVVAFNQALPSYAAPSTGGITTGTTCTTTAAGPTYVTSATTQTCDMRIRIGAITGNLR